MDLVAARAAASTAVDAGIQHFVYVSVAQPAPVMKAYVAVRAECEEFIRASGLNATILRPWYVLGPGRRWPYLLAPMYWLFERLPATRGTAERLGLVTIEQMFARSSAQSKTAARVSASLAFPKSARGVEDFTTPGALSAVELSPKSFTA